LHSPDWQNGFAQGVNSALVAVEHLLNGRAVERAADAEED